MTIPMAHGEHHMPARDASIWLPIPEGDLNEDWAYLLGFLKALYRTVWVTRYDRYSDTLDAPDVDFDLLVQLFSIRNLELLTCMEAIAASRGAGMSNPAAATYICMDKRKLPGMFPDNVPDTRVVRDIEAAEACFEAWGHDIVVKPPFFGKGEYVTRIRSHETLGTVSDLLKLSLTGDLVVQPFCEGFAEGDQRIILARDAAGDGIILGSFARRPAPGDWISNISRGGSFDFCPLQKDEARLALDVFDRTGLDYAGLDIGRHDGRALLIEINPSAGGMIDCDISSQTNTQAVLYDLFERRIRGEE